MSGLTKELHNNFEADSQDLLDDVKGQLENSDNFEGQQKQIASLEERVKAGKDKADALTARLAEAKGRVEKRAKSEAEWEASTNRMSQHILFASYALTISAGWWQWFGGVFVSIVSLITILVVLHHLKPTHVDMSPKPTLDPVVEAKIRDAPIPEMAKKDILELATSVSTVRLQMPHAQSSTGMDDQLLRKFDEL